MNNQLSEVSNESVNLIIVGSESGDWYGIYVDGEIETQGHNLYTDDWIRLIAMYQIFSGDIKVYEISDVYCEEFGSFPDKFEDIPKHFIAG